VFGYPTLAHLWWSMQYLIHIDAFKFIAYGRSNLNVLGLLAGLWASCYPDAPAREQCARRVAMAMVRREHVLLTVVDIVCMSFSVGTLVRL
jgi:hypothetical protein